MFCLTFDYKLTPLGMTTFFEDPEQMHEVGIAIKRGKLKVDEAVKTMVDSHYYWEGF